MLKKLSILLLFLIFVISLPTVMASDNTEPSYAASGKCGDNLTWTLDSDGTLTISGSGDMYDWVASTVPWASYALSVKKAVIGEQVKISGRMPFIPVLT